MRLDSHWKSLRSAMNGYDSKVQEIAQKDPGLYREAEGVLCKI